MIIALHKMADCFPAFHLFFLYFCFLYVAYIESKTQKCCDNRVKDKDRVIGLTECCGQELFNPQTSLCCDGQIHFVTDTSNYTCCGGKAMDRRRQQCIDGSCTTCITLHFMTGKRAFFTNYYLFVHWFFKMDCSTYNTTMNHL